MAAADPVALQQQLSAADPDDIYDALIDIGKGGLESLAEAVAPFLTHRKGFLRGAAIRVLAFYWQRPEYRETAERMWRSDHDEEVQGIALMGWAQYAAGSKDSAIQRTLIDLLLDTDAGEELRAQAWMSLVSVAGIPHDQRPEPARYGHVDEDIDWDLVDRLESALSSN